MATKIKGHDLLVFTGTGTNRKAIAGQTTCELDTDCEMIEVSSPTTGSWRTYKPGRKGWKVTCGTLLLLDKRYDISTMLGTELDICFARSETKEESNPDIRKPDTTKKLIYYGKAFLRRSTLSAKNGDKGTQSYEFQGSGPLNSEMS